MVYKSLIWAEGGNVLSDFNFYCKKEKILNILKKLGSSVHFVGVGGVGMYSLFLLTEKMGISTSGSDRECSRFTNRLIREGKKITIGHRADSVCGADLVVYTSAVSPNNPELIGAVQNGIPLASRAEYLGAVMENYKERIGVSGTHGKSTVTAMLSAIFEQAEKNPTTVLGAVIPSTDLPIKIGGNTHFIYEACEYKDAFLSFSPTAAVYTNLEFDHMDYFKSIESLEESFLKSMNMPRICVVNADDKRLSALIPYIKSDVVTYGESEGAEYRAIVTGEENGYYCFEVHHRGENISKIRMSILGKFNVLNGLGAFALAHKLGISKSVIEEALSHFSGIERRLEKIGKYGLLDLYYDYAHHPTEIECTVNTLREITGGEVTVIFKPHTYSRTAGLMNEFARALSLADRVYLCDISAIRENSIKGITSEHLASLIGASAERIDEDNIKAVIDTRGIACKNGTLVIMGAANMDDVKKQFTDDVMFNKINEN